MKIFAVLFILGGCAIAQRTISIGTGSGQRSPVLRIQNVRRSFSPVVVEKSPLNSSKTVTDDWNVLYQRIRASRFSEERRARSSKSYSKYPSALQSSSTSWKCGGIRKFDARPFSDDATNAVSVPSFHNDTQRYRNNVDCSWIITAPRSHLVRLDFAFFELEYDRLCRADSISVYDGPSDQSELLTRMCGRHKELTITSSWRTLFVRLLTDDTITERGFTFRYYSTRAEGRRPRHPSPHIDVPSLSAKRALPKALQTAARFVATLPPAFIRRGRFVTHGPPNTHFSAKPSQRADERRKAILSRSPTMLDACGITERFDERGVIFSPGYISEGKYPNDAQCQWRVFAPTGYHVQLRFVHFDVEPGLSDGGCEYDVVFVFDGDTFASPYLLEHCGNSIPHPITSSGTSIMLEFMSDPSVARRGFIVDYQAVHGRSHRPALTLHLLSPSTPTPVPTLPMSTEMVATPSALVSSSTPHLEPTTSEAPTTVELSDQASTGSSLPTTTAIATASRDAPGSSTSTTSSYSHLSSLCDQVVELVSETGTIASPGFNGSSFYLNNLECRWLIRAPSDMVVVFWFETLALEDAGCMYDYVELRDSASEDGALIGRFCGTSIPRKVQSAGRTVSIIFRSDSSITFLGFKAHFRCVAPEPSCDSSSFSCLLGNCVPSTARCNNITDCHDGSDEKGCLELRRCGEPAFEPWLGNTRIVGGQEARNHSWPWQVQLLYGGNHYCGATVLSDSWIVTAAHCVERRLEIAMWTAVLGRHHKTNTEPSQQFATIRSIVMHPSYSSQTVNNDIALMRLTSSVQINKYVQTICIPATPPDLDATTCHTTGWGAVLGSGSASVLKQINVPIINRTTCNLAHYYDDSITDQMICAGYPEGRFDACQGDSGGPFVCQRDNKWELTGITSWGYACAAPFKPGVYTNVIHFADWIRNTITSTD